MAIPTTIPTDYPPIDSPLNHDFSQYLRKEKRFSYATIESYRYSLSRFFVWLQSQSLSVELLSYPQLLLYIKSRRAKGDGKRYINHTLMAIRHYFDFLIAKELLLYNPASNLYIRGVKRSIPHHLLDKGQLEKLYDTYRVIDEGSHRNKVMLGLLIFQGLPSMELARLKVYHIDLKGAHVTIADTTRGNGRRLALEPKQVILLKEYLTLIRPQLLHMSGVREEALEEQLFFSRQGARDLTNILMILMGELRKKDVSLRNAPHIRMSVITEWLKTKDVRIVQHMAGHKYVSSTERYQVSQLAALQAELAQFHPLE